MHEVSVRCLITSSAWRRMAAGHTQSLYTLDGTVHQCQLPKAYQSCKDRAVPYSSQYATLSPRPNTVQVLGALWDYVWVYFY